MKKYIFISAIAFGIFLSPHLSHAAIVWDTTGAVPLLNATDAGNYPTGLGVMARYSTSAFKAQSTQPIGTTLYFAVRSGPNWNSDCNDAVNGLVISDINTGPTIVGNLGGLLGSSPNTLYTGSFTSASQVNTTDAFLLAASSSLQCDIQGDFTGLDPTVARPIDTWFYLATTPFPLSNPSVNFVMPDPSASTTYPDLKNWKIKFNVDTASTTYFTAKVEWGNSTSTMTNFDLFPYDFQNSFPSTAGFLDVPLIIRKNVSWTQGETIYAKAQIYEYDCVPFSADCFRQIVNSNIINFTVDLNKKLTADNFSSSTDPAIIGPIQQSIRDVTYVNNPNNFFGISSSTPTSTITAASAGCVPAADWTDIGGGLTYAGCSIINYLFVPSTSTLQNFGSVMQNIQSAPPFNFFFNANQQIGIYIAASSSAVGVAWELPYIGADGVSSDTLMLMPANAADIPFVGGGAGSFVNDLWNLILDFMMLLCVAIIIVAGKFFIDLI